MEILEISIFQLIDLENFAFVRYFNKSEAEDALHGLDGSKVGGRELRIKIDKNLPL